MLHIPVPASGGVFMVFILYLILMESWISVFSDRYSDLKTVFAGPSSLIWVSRIRYIRVTKFLKI